jgi:hypothetical protein
MLTRTEAAAPSSISPHRGMKSRAADGDGIAAVVASDFMRPPTQKAQGRQQRRPNGMGIIRGRAPIDPSHL